MAVIESPTPARPASPAPVAHDAPVAVALSTVDKLLANPLVAGIVLTKVFTQRARPAAAPA